MKILQRIFAKKKEDYLDESAHEASLDSLFLPEGFEYLGFEVADLNCSLNAISIGARLIDIPVELAVNLNPISDFPDCLFRGKSFESLRNRNRNWHANISIYDNEFVKKDTNSGYLVHDFNLSFSYLDLRFKRDQLPYIYQGLLSNVLKYLHINIASSPDRSASNRENFRIERASFTNRIE